MKKNLFRFGMIMAALSLIFTGCNMGADDDNKSSSPSTEKHEWTATSISAKESDSKKDSISTYDKVILAGTYSKTAFEITADDDYYFSDFAAENAGTTKYKKVSSETSLSVNGTVIEDGKEFTVEMGKNYKLVFTYKTLTSELNLTGSTLGSFLNTDELTIENVENEPIPEIVGLYVLSTYSHSLIGTDLSKELVKFADLTSDKVTVFVGSDKSNLKKLEGELSSYTVNTTDKIMYIYNEKNLSSVTAATTVPCMVQLKITPYSEVKNLKFDFDTPITANTETNLLSVLGENKKIHCYGDNLKHLGSLSVYNAEGKIRSGLKFEVFANKNLTGDVVTTIDSNTTADAKWTPGTGTEIKKWRKESTVVSNGVTTITHSNPYTENNYFVKITYTYKDSNSIVSSNVFRKDSNGEEYDYIYNYIKVNPAN